MPLQNHHLLPQELLPGGGDEHDIFDTPGLRDIYDNDSPKYNIMGLPDTWEGVFQPHTGAHPGYTKWVNDQLDSIHKLGLQDPVEVHRQLVGLSNVIKLNLANPKFDIALNKIGTEAVFAGWSESIDFADYAGVDIPDDANARLSYEAFKLGDELGLSIGAGQKGKFPALVNLDGDSPFNTFKYNVFDTDGQYENLGKLVGEFNYVRANLPNDYDSTNVDHRKRAADAINFAWETGSHENIPEYLRGEDVTLSAPNAQGKTVVLFSAPLATTLAASIGLLGHGSTIIDLASISLISHGLIESGIIPEGTGLGDLIEILANSNIADAVVDQLGNIAGDIATDVAISSAATVLGVGLLWNGYEVLQSLSGLAAALEYADKNSDNETIADLNKTVKELQNWFGQDGHDKPEFVPEYQELANLLTVAFEDFPQTLATIGFAVKEHLRAQGDNSWLLVADNDVEGALFHLQELVDKTVVRCNLSCKQHCSTVMI